MFDCLPQFADICIPSEYRDFWTFEGGPRVRPNADQMRTDGPVFIKVESSDGIPSQPLDGLRRMEIDDWTVFYQFRCDSGTSCLLRASAGQTEAIRTAPRPGAALSNYAVTSRDAESMEAALGKIRYCLALDGCKGPSVSFAELRSGTRALDCAPGAAPFCIPSEYDAYWNLRGMQRRSTTAEIKIDGPVFIDVPATDNISFESSAGLARFALGEVTVHYRLDCQGGTICRLRIASVPGSDLASALRSVGRELSPRSNGSDVFLRRLNITSTNEAAMAEALAKIRYCNPGLPQCSVETSVSLAELSAAQRQE